MVGAGRGDERLVPPHAFQLLMRVVVSPHCMLHALGARLIPDSAAAGCRPRAVSGSVSVVGCSFGPCCIAACMFWSVFMCVCVGLALSSA